LRPPDAPSLPRPRRRPVPYPVPRRAAGAQPGMEGHCAAARGGDRGHLAGRLQSRAVDGALPHRRTQPERHDVQLQRGPRPGAGPMTAGPAGTPLDVLVIGGGQAGLAMGYHLAQSGRSFQIVDVGAEIGHVWRSRWDSLRLFTSGRYDNLPGLPFPAAPDAYPGKDDVASYLEAYAAKFELPVRLDVKVTSLTRGGGYVAKAGGEEL